MKPILVLVFIVCILSCKNQNEKKIFEEQEKLKQYIESKEDRNKSEYNIPKEKVIFLEILEYQSAKIINNDPRLKLLVGPLIDFPTYFYNDSIETLETRDRPFRFELENVKLIIGKGLILGENRGGGAATKLYHINNLPYFNEETAIYEVDNSGTVYLRHENIYYKIKSGERLVDSAFFIIKVKDPFEGQGRVKREFRISNYGLLNKKSIIFDTIKNN